MAAASHTNPLVQVPRVVEGHSPGHGRGQALPSSDLPSTRPVLCDLLGTHGLARAVGDGPECREMWRDSPGRGRVRQGPGGQCLNN